ncbi:EcsC family protein [Frondihabitans cladoniiphilus]
MADPSEYELDAWASVQRFKTRPFSSALTNVNQQMVAGAAELGKRATEYLESHPKAGAAVSRGQKTAAKGAGAVKAGARKVGEALPAGAADWGSSAAGSIRDAVARVAGAGLSPKGVIKQHRRRGHDVSKLSDLRRLDLEQVDLVRGRAAAWYYPAMAALSGAGAGFVISGSELVVPATGGAAAAPSGTAIVAAFAGDAALVLGLSSRSVGQIALQYGYDPEDPAEKVFVMSVIDAGTAASQAAKTAAFSDISRLTQALVRGKTWEVLDKSVVSKVAKQFASMMGKRLTKKSLGKAVPAVGIALGGAFNWATLEGVVDAANIAYRRRFLLEKYPQLEASSSFEVTVTDAEGLGGPTDTDETISVLDELRDAGGPDLN